MSYGDSHKSQSFLSQAARAMMSIKAGNAIVQ